MPDFKCPYCGSIETVVNENLEIVDCKKCHLRPAREDVNVRQNNLPDQI